jgi:uncharacterized protein (TIRG00374 family)
MEKPSVDTSKLLPSRKAIVRGIQAFIIFSAAGTLLSLWWKRPAGLEAVLTGLDWRFMLLLLPLIGLDYWLGGLRYRLFLNGNHFPNVSLLDCMRSNWANMFMGAATPFQSGGGPAQMYVLWRKGVRVADSLLLSTVNLSATLVFFLLSSLVALLWIPADLFGENFTMVFRLGFVVVGGIAGMVLLVLFFPKSAHVVLEKLLGLLPLRGARANQIRTRFLEKVAAETQRFGDGFRSILKHNKIGLVLTVLATLVLFSNKYLMGYVIARAMGQDVPFDVFIGLQIIQLLLIYFAPTPGASGVAELSSVWLMGKLMPESLLLIYAILWRFFTTILAAIIGGFVLLREVQDLEQPAEKET